MTINPQGYVSPRMVVLCDQNGQPVNVTGNALNTTGSGAASTNLTQLAGTAVDVNNGAVSAGTLRVTLANNSTGQVALASGATVGLVAGTAIVGKVGIDQTTPGTTNGVQVNAALPAGANVIGKVSIDQTTPGTTNLVALAANQSVNVAQVSGTTADVNNGTVSAGTLRVTIASNSTGQVALAAGTAVVGQVNLAPQTSGGTTMAHAINPNNVTGVVVKNSAGQLYGVTMCTSGSVAAYLHLYNSSSAPTAGAGTIVKTLICPGPSVGGGGASYQWPNGIAFSAGIAYTFTSGISDTDSGQPTQTTFSIDFDYK